MRRSVACTAMPMDQSSPTLFVDLPSAVIASSCQSSSSVPGQVLGGLAVLASTCTSTRLFEAKLHMRPQRYLIAYPLALIYSCFVLITIF